MRAMAAPASLKGVLSAGAAAEALAEGLRAGGAEAVAIPVADGGDGTLDVLGGAVRNAEVAAPLGGRITARWALRDDGTAIVESAEALGFHTVRELDPIRASSRGLGELILAAAREARALLVCLGGTVTVDGGAGMREVLRRVAVADARGVRRSLAAARRGIRLRRGRKVRPTSSSTSWPNDCAACLTSRVPARPAGWAERSQRSAPSSCRVRSSCSTRSASTRAATTSSSRARAPSTRRRGKARRRARSCAAAARRACAASCSRRATISPAIRRVRART